jgi:hypothetical protein
MPSRPHSGRIILLESAQLRHHLTLYMYTSGGAGGCPTHSGECVRQAPLL